MSTSISRFEANGLQCLGFTIGESVCREDVNVYRRGTKVQDRADVGEIHKSISSEKETYVGSFRAKIKS